MIFKHTEHNFDFRLIGKINKRITLSWFFFMFFSNNFWGLFFWGTVPKGYTLSQHLVSSHFGGFLSLSLILTSLFFCSSTSFILRTILISIAGSAGIIISLSLNYTIAGISTTKVEFFYVLIFCNAIGFFYFCIPLYWQWRGELERSSSSNSLKKSDSILNNYIAGLNLTEKITSKITMNWLKLFFIVWSLGAVNGWLSYAEISFYQHLIFNYCVGVCSLLPILSSLYLFDPRRFFIRLIMILGFGNIGMTVGIFVGSTFSGIPISYTTFGSLHLFYSIISFACFGSIFYWQWRTKSNKNLNNETIKRLKLQKEIEKNRLIALQAQMEPEFLFQTLSNIQELLLKDPEKGKAMQLNLIQYLRASLSKINIGAAPISQQLDMLRAFHEINKPKMQSNTCFNIEVPKKLENREFPPMLVQPLFENAVNQRVADEITGGEISISIEEDNNVLRLVFKDKGDLETIDRSKNFPFTGIEKRLQTLFGSQGKLFINENRVGGLEAVIEVPQLV